MTTKSTYIYTLTSGVFFLSLVSIFGRLLTGSHGFVNTFFGYLIVLLSTCLWLCIRGRFRSIRLKEKRWDILFMGLGQLGSAAFFVEAIQTIDFATVGLLLYSAPIWIVLIYFFTGEERLSTGIILPFMLGMCGLVLVLGPNVVLSPSEMSFHLILALLSGVSYAISYVFARRVRDAYGTGAMVFWNHLIGVFVLFPLLLMYPLRVDSVVLVGFLGLGISWTFGYFLLYFSLRHIQAHYASLIALVEPVLIAFWGWFFFQETLAPLTLLGGAIILFNIYLINRQME